MLSQRKSLKLRVKALAACVPLLAVTITIACSNRETEHYAAAMTGGEPSRGRTALRRYGCSTCHTIPGVQGANALVGPPLTQVASRSYIGGVLPNTPDNMIHWIEDPPGIDHLTAMPNLGVTDQDARDMASYLYTLK